MMPDYERAARYLFDLLDDIDTVSDVAKEDDKIYRSMVERIHGRRFQVATTDGYTVTFKDDPGELRRAIVPGEDGAVAAWQPETVTTVTATAAQHGVMNPDGTWTVENWEANDAESKE